MKKIIKNTIKLLIKGFIAILSKMNPGRYFIDQLIKNISFNKKNIEHNGIKFQFFTPNRLSYFRTNTFATKEPETLNWIEKFKKKKYFGI